MDIMVAFRMFIPMGVLVEVHLVVLIVNIMRLIMGVLMDILPIELLRVFMGVPISVFFSILGVCFLTCKRVRVSPSVSAKFKNVNF